MKKVAIGMIIGVAICGLAFFIMLPSIKKNSYDAGYTIGKKDGVVVGTQKGIETGIAQIKAQIKTEQDRISLEKKKEAARKAAVKPKKIEQETQNWHVIDGKIADPINN